MEEAKGSKPVWKVAGQWVCMVILAGCMVQARAWISHTAGSSTFCVPDIPEHAGSAGVCWVCPDVATPVRGRVGSGAGSSRPDQVCAEMGECSTESRQQDQEKSRCSASSGPAMVGISAGAAPAIRGSEATVPGRLAKSELLEAKRQRAEALQRLQASMTETAMEVEPSAPMVSVEDDRHWEELISDVAPAEDEDLQLQKLLQQASASGPRFLTMADKARVQQWIDKQGTASTQLGQGSGDPWSDAGVHDSELRMSLAQSLMHKPLGVLQGLPPRSELLKVSHELPCCQAAARTHVQCRGAVRQSGYALPTTDGRSQHAGFANYRSTGSAIRGCRSIYVCGLSECAWNGGPPAVSSLRPTQATQTERFSQRLSQAGWPLAHTSPEYVSRRSVSGQKGSVRECSHCLCRPSHRFAVTCACDIAGPSECGRASGCWATAVLVERRQRQWDRPLAGTSPPGDVMD